MWSGGLACPASVITSRAAAAAATAVRTSVPRRALLRRAGAFPSSREKTPNSFFVLFPFSRGNFSSLCFRDKFSFVTSSCPIGNCFKPFYYSCVAASSAQRCSGSPETCRSSTGGGSTVDAGVLASWTMPSGPPRRLAASPSHASCCPLGGVLAPRRVPRPRVPPRQQLEESCHLHHTHAGVQYGREESLR